MIKKKVLFPCTPNFSGNRTKELQKFLASEFDYVVTVYDNAKENCPFFPGTKEYLHRGFVDPSGLNGPEDEIMNEFKKVRDENRAWIVDVFGKK